MGNKTKIHTVYRTTSGEHVPNVTTVLSVLNKLGLLQWAWQCGCYGLDYREIRDLAGNIGTLAHYLILCHLKGETPDTAEYSKAEIDKAETCLIKYWDWQKENPFEAVLVEQSLVSDKYAYGGTIDCVAKSNGNLVLIDYKTGKGIYEEMFYQLAAYKQLLIENGYPVTKARILRIGRDGNEGFEIREAGNLDNEFQIFLDCLDIYKRKQNRR